MPIEHIWSYYQAVAEEIGKETDNEGKPLAFNKVITTFFDSDADPNEQNDLVRVFLGDTEARLTWNMDNITLNDIEPYLSSKSAPYSAQKNAVLNALNKPISIVQGPPGTGKTETILNLLSAIRGLYPEKTVAVVSTNNEAVNNIYDKIKKCHEERSADFDPIIGRLYNCFAVLGNSSVRKKWKKAMEERNIDTTGLCSGNKFSPRLLEDFPLFSSTIHSLKSNFTNEGDFDGQFDFVIMDEASQTNIMLGIIAMSCAKQMVVIGDDKQLSPIIKDSAIEVGRLFGDDINLYKEEDGKSFLSLCGQVFAPDIPSVFLNEHFRCHPSIISFCNQYVYENKLILRKKGDGFKIRAVWYEGDYCEKITQIVEDNTYNKIYNMRQIKIFMEEEMPRLSALMRENPDLSVMIIAPFREQIARLKEALKQQEIAYEDAKDNDDEEAEELLNYNNIFCLTIHKSQGKGYDLVYMLTTEDYSTSDEPWCQRMRLMNVAVSRAKKEFCVITASQWLPEEFQQRFTNYTLPINTNNLEDGDSMYFCKLMNYIGCNCPEPQGDYGFHKSNITSVFDKVPYFRMKYNTGKNCSGANSAPARCVKEMLKEIIEGLPQKEDYTILTEVPLKCFQLEGQAVSSDDGRLMQYSENAKCDFAVCKGEQVRLILEVDGSFHRSGDEYQESCDELKNRWINEVLKGGSLFLRLTTDGSSSGERDKLTDLILNSENSEITVTAKEVEIAVKENIRQTAVQVLSQKTWEAFEELKERIRLALNQLQLTEFISLDQVLTNPNNLDGLVELPIFQALARGNNYYAPKGVSYDKKITSDFYLCRYAVAYAFEYAMMYDIVMRSFIKNGGHDTLGVFSFGCGSMLDALSMAYSKARLSKFDGRYKRCKLYYKGIDRTEWDRTYAYQTLAQNIDEADDLIRSQFEKIYFFKKDINSFLQGNIIESSSNSVYHNVLFFPKILNEMKQSVIERLISQLSQLNFDLDEYYVCVSHSFSNVQYGGADIVTRIVDTINRDNQFEVCGDIWEMIGAEERESFEKAWLGKKDKQDIIDDLIDITQNNEDLTELTRGENLWDIISDKHSEKPSFPCYCFKSKIQNKIQNHWQEEDNHYPQCIKDLNGDFSVNGVINDFFSNALDNVLDETCKHLNIKDKNTCPISRVSQITFQIIRLKRR